MKERYQKFYESFIGATHEAEGQLFSREVKEKTRYKVKNVKVESTMFMNVETGKNIGKLGVKFLLKNEKMLRAQWTKPFRVCAESSLEKWEKENVES